MRPRTAHACHLLRDLESTITERCRPGPRRRQAGARPWPGTHPTDIPGQPAGSDCSPHARPDRTWLAPHGRRAVALTSWSTTATPTACHPAHRADARATGLSSGKPGRERRPQPQQSHGVRASGAARVAIGPHCAVRPESPEHDCEMLKFNRVGGGNIHWLHPGDLVSALIYRESR